jgi:hypothetical protein
MTMVESGMTQGVAWIGHARDRMRAAGVLTRYGRLQWTSIGSSKLRRNADWRFATPLRHHALRVH